MTPLLTAASTLALLVTLGYGLLCAVQPFGPCRHCHGTGRVPTHIGRLRRDCHHCHHTGRRIRTGRRLWTYLKDTHRRGTH